MKFNATRDYEKDFAEADKYMKNHVSAEPTKQFVPMAFNNIKDREWRIQNRCPISGYLYIAHRAIRAKSKYDIYDLFHRYFKNNKIASAPSLREIADAFGYKQLTMPREWIEKLEAQGAFIIEQIPVKGKPEPANVYVLGEYLPDEIIWYYGNLRLPRPPDTVLL